MTALEAFLWDDDPEVWKSDDLFSDPDFPFRVNVPFGDEVTESEGELW